MGQGLCGLEIVFGNIIDRLQVAYLRYIATKFIDMNFHGLFTHCGIHRFTITQIIYMFNKDQTSILIRWHQ